MSGTTSGTGAFQVANGQIIDPNGAVFTARGLNVYDAQMGNATQILADFPGLNFVRLNVYSYQSPSAYSAFIQTMTSHGVVVELEDHTNSNGSNAGGGQGTAFTGSQLTAESNWYASVAQAFASNPYVWFGTNNEPPQAGLTAWEQATYSAIRGAGNNNPIMMELPGGGYPGNTAAAYGMNASAYASMSNIVIDAHYYGWSSNYSTNQQTVDSTLTALVQGAQSITSANGTVPVIIGEYGPSTDGVNTDANSAQVLQAVQHSAVISGAVAWGWNSGANDNLTNGSGQLTSYGQEVANWISSSAPASPTPAPVVTPVVTPSANDAVVKAGSTTAIVDASGNRWTITGNGQVAVNGVVDASTANVTELAYVNGTVWQENASNLWWGKTSPAAAWSPTNGTATSPLPAAASPTPAPVVTPVVTPSANDAVVKAGSTAAIVDASGNRWTITGGGQVAVNGVADASTANVTELAYVNGTVWQENASKLWWGKTSPAAAWSPTNGTATSPLPAAASPTPAPVVTPVVTPSANDAVVKAGSTAAIVDASGNRWTITGGGQVAVNGVADASTANVTELAYVNGTVWQENASNLWWGKTSPAAAWSPTNGTATSPLPAAAPTPGAVPVPTPAPTPAPVPTTTPVVTPSANDAVVKAGSTAAIVDASGNRWTITGNGQVAVNGVADASTANVTELAYVNGTVWQENASKLWWGKTSPAAAWSPTNGTATSPLQAGIVIPSYVTSATVQLDQVTISATAGNHMLFLSGSNNTVQMTGGKETITDTGSANTFVVPAAGNGLYAFTSNILTGTDTLDLRPALAASQWNGVASSLSQYLSVTHTAQGAVLSIASSPGGAMTAIASIAGATQASLSTVLAHAIT